MTNKKKKNIVQNIDHFFFKDFWHQFKRGEKEEKKKPLTIII